MKMALEHGEYQDVEHPTTQARYILENRKPIFCLGEHEYLRVMLRNQITTLSGPQLAATLKIYQESNEGLCEKEVRESNALCAHNAKEKDPLGYDDVICLLREHRIIPANVLDPIAKENDEIVEKIKEFDNCLSENADQELVQIGEGTPAEKKLSCEERRSMQWPLGERLERIRNTLLLLLDEYTASPRRTQDRPVELLTR